MSCTCVDNQLSRCFVSCPFGHALLMSVKSPHMCHFQLDFLTNTTFDNNPRYWVSLINPTNNNRSTTSGNRLILLRAKTSSLLPDWPCTQTDIQSMHYNFLAISKHVFVNPRKDILVLCKKLFQLSHFTTRYSSSNLNSVLWFGWIKGDKF